MFPFESKIFAIPIVSIFGIVPIAGIIKSAFILNSLPLMILGIFRPDLSSAPSFVLKNSIPNSKIYRNNFFQNQFI